MRRAARTMLAMGAALLFGYGCLEMPTIAADSCGNGVLEGLEECDTYPLGRCGTAGEAAACRFKCDPTQSDPGLECPAGWYCGADRICRQPTGEFVERARAFVPDESRPFAADIDGDHAANLVAVGTGGLRILGLDENGTFAPSYVGGRGTRNVPAIGRLTSPPDRRDDVAFLSQALIVGAGQENGEIWSVVYSSLAFAPPVETQVRFVECRTPRVDPADGATAGVGQELLVLLRMADSLTTVVCASASRRIRQVWYVDGELLPQTHGNIPTGQIAEGPDYACDEVVIGRDGQATLDIVPLCIPFGDLTGWPDTLEPMAQVVLEPGTLSAADDPRGRSHLLADLNLDGHLDLLLRGSEPAVAGCPGAGGGGGAGGGDVGGAGGDGGGAGEAGGTGGAGGAPVASWDTRIFAAYGVGDGHFHSDPSEVDAVAAGTLAPDDAPSPYCVRIDFAASGNAPDPSVELPLAVAELTGDERVDFVYADGLLLSIEGGAVRPGGYLAERPVSFTANWADAADFHGDGRTDVLIAGSGVPSLAFLTGGPAGELTRSIIPLAGPPEALVVGDVDGDQRPDVIVGQRGPHLGDPGVGGAAGSEGALLGDLLGVSYGNPAGPPGEPVTVGRLARVTSIAAGNFSLDGFLDGARDLAITTLSEDEQSSGVSFALGDASRMLISPYLFTEGAEETLGLEVPLALTVGDFDLEPPDDLAVLTRSEAAEPGDPGEPAMPSLALWLLPLTGDAQVAVAEPATLELDRYSLWAPAAMLATIDLDGDGVDELVTLAPDVDVEGDSATEGKRGRIVVLHANEDRTGWLPPEPEDMLLIEDETYARFSDYAPRVSTGRQRESQLAVADIDEDGWSDLLVLALSAAETPRLVAFLGDGSGRLSLEQRVVLYDPAEGGPLGNPVDFALLQNDADLAPEIVLATDLDLLLADFQHDSTASSVRLDVEAARPIAAANPESALIRFVTTGDFDGDGLDDVVAAGANGQIVLLGARAVRP